MYCCDPCKPSAEPKVSEFALCLLWGQNRLEVWIVFAIGEKQLYVTALVVMT